MLKLNSSNPYEVSEHPSVNFREYIKSKYKQLEKDTNDRLTPPISKVSDFLINPLTKREFLPSEVKLIIIGQDPYPTAGLACGHAFCHNQRVLPQGSGKSLYRIYECFYGKGKVPYDADPMLKHIREQGVMLINAGLTTVVGKTSQHLDFWKTTVRSIIESYYVRNKRIIILALGRKAQDIVSHSFVLSLNIVNAHHPNAREAGGKPRFLADTGCFDVVNQRLEQHNVEPLVWI